MRARSITLPFPGLSASKLLFNQGGMVRRISVAETTGTAGAQIKLFDGTGTGGIQVDNIILTANQSTRDYYRWDEYPIQGGLYCQVVSGTVDLAVVITPADMLDRWGEPVIVIGTLDVDVLGA